MNPEDRWRDGIEREQRDLRKKIDDLEEEIHTLKSDRKFLAGSVMVLVWMLGFLSDKIKHALGL